MSNITSKTRSSEVQLRSWFLEAQSRTWSSARQPGENDLDYLHRLAKMGLKPKQISERVQIPLENVVYVMERNGYLD